VAAKDIVDVAQARRIDIQNAHIGPHADSRLTGICSDYAGAENNHVAGLYPGRAAQQYAPTAIMGLEAPGPHLKR